MTVTANMKRLIAAATTCSLLLSACTSPPPQAVAADDRSAIRTRYFSLDTLFAQDRMTELAKVYHDSAVIVSHGKEIKGREAIANYWDLLTGHGVSWDHRIDRLDIRGDRAIQTGISDLHYTSGADTLISYTRYTLIWSKDNNGQWWIDRDHYSAAQRMVYE